MSKPAARDRLTEAALTLFDESGYEQTTVALVAVSDAVRLVLLHYLEEGDLAHRRYA